MIQDHWGSVEGEDHEWTSQRAHVDRDERLRMEAGEEPMCSGWTEKEEPLNATQELCRDGGAGTERRPDAKRNMCQAPHCGGAQRELGDKDSQKQHQRSCQGQWRDSFCGWRTGEL